MYGSWDPPGARLLDAVAVMDRLASPGGDPWKRQQTHASLAPVPARGELRGVRRDRGRRPGRAARGARRRAAAGGAARPAGRGPARGRALDRRRRGRRPGGQDGPAQPARLRRASAVDGVEEIIDNWERIKKAEKSRDSVAGRHRAEPAGAALAAKILQRAERAGLARAAAGRSPDLGRDAAAAGRRGRARRALDAEAALRQAALAYAATVRDAEPAVTGDRRTGAGDAGARMSDPAE